MKRVAVLVSCLAAMLALIQIGEKHAQNEHLTSHNLAHQQLGVLSGEESVLGRLQAGFGRMRSVFARVGGHDLA